MYDIDGNGTIDQNEMIEIIRVRFNFVLIECTRYFYLQSLPARISAHHFASSRGPSASDASAEGARTLRAGDLLDAGRGPGRERRRDEPRDAHRGDLPQDGHQRRRRPLQGVHAALLLP